MALLPCVPELAFSRTEPIKYLHVRHKNFFNPRRLLQTPDLKLKWILMICNGVFLEMCVEKALG